MLMIAAAALVLVAPQPDADYTTPLAKPPLPLLTEILFAVPPGESGDAWPDGARDATGDEFVELHNPHEAAIDLTGYSLSDRNKGDRGEVGFTFPRFTLGPGETVVVFNGHGQTMDGDVGTASRAPERKSERLGCWVFTAGNTNKYAAFSNKGDWVLLSDAERRPVHVVYWGEFDQKLPEVPTLLVEEVSADIAGSACRYWFGGPMVSHPDIDGSDTSPGRFPVGPSPEEAAASAVPAEDEDGEPDPGR
jgi:hypothetical protein